jgi:predicted ATP-binding protein involved in virulence
VENGHFVVLFETETGTKIPFLNLGTAYKSLITWVLDLAYRMFVRYPESAHPLEEPAIVLVDELDAHLHLESQRRVVGFLRKVFPKTQFIATAQNPFLLQDCPYANLMILKKEANSDLVNIRQLSNTSFEGWKIEEILKLLD